MYDGQTIICQKIVEENWLEYLAYVKKRSDEEYELSMKRQEALKDIDLPNSRLGNIAAVQTEPMPAYDHRYYDLGLPGFWNWYIANKI